MSVRFVLGRAGVGKTHHCLTQITSQLDQNAGEGQRLFLLVPEQASMQMERSLLERPGVDGFGRCEVLSFRRLAHRVLASCGSGLRTVSPVGRLMILRRVVDQHADRLKLLRGRSRRRGLIDRLGRTLDELIQEEVAPESLTETAERLAPEDELLSTQLREVGLIYRGYLDRLGGELSDPGHHLGMARERLDAYPGLRGSRVWVDGFAGLTRQELHLLTSLAGLVEHMVISLLLDPDGAVVQSHEPVEPFHLFARTERTYVSLNQALLEAGVEVDEPLILSGPPKRFSRSLALARLERELFAVPSGRRTGKDDAEPGGAIRLVQAATPRVEVAAAVTEIQRLVRRPADPLRYRDIAVIVRDLDLYHDLLSAALTAAGIPHFIDRRRPIAHHALVELVRSAIELARHMDAETVSEFVKTGLVGLGDDEAHLLENHLRANGVVGQSQWTQGDWVFRRRPSDSRADEPTRAEAAELRRLNAMRTELIAALEPLRQLADAPESPAAAEWAGGLFDVLERLEVPEQLSKWADRADRAGCLDEAAEHRQVWEHCVALLDELSGAFADEPMTLDELAEVVDTGLVSSTLGLAPPTLDQVLVGSIERSRHPAIRAAMILGFGEGVFPPHAREDPIFSDRHRLELSKAGVELAATSRQQLLDERMLAYIALTRPSEVLWISWPAAEQDGRVRHPSPFVQAVRAVFPDLPVTEVSDPASVRACWGIATADDLSAGVVADLRVRMRQATPAPDDDRRWNALYEWARCDEATGHRLRQAVGALSYANRAALAPEAVERLYGDALYTSVSQLETFAACPFQHFAQYALRLEERQEWALAEIDLGLLSHRILEAYVSSLIAARQRLDSGDPDALTSRIQDLSRRALDELADEAVVEDARNAYLIDRVNTDLLRAMAAHRLVAAAGQYRPVGVEVSFGMPTPEEPRPGQTFLPALEIVTPAKRQVRLRGKIDRVDLAELGGRALASVVDYKRSAHASLELDRVYHGLDLQLLTYLLVIGEHGQALTGGPVEPAGSFYATLRGELRRLKGPPEAPPDEAERYGGLRPRGMLRSEDLDAFDEDVQPSSSSTAVSARRNKDGTLSQADHYDTAPSESFAGVLDYVRRKLGALCDRLLDGVIDVDPYRLRDKTPCTFCPYQPVCRFEVDAHRPRPLRAMKRGEVLAEIGQPARGGDDE